MIAKCLRPAWVIGFLANLGYSEKPFSKSQGKKEKEKAEKEDEEEEEEEQKQQEERLRTMVTMEKGSAISFCVELQLEH